MENLDNLRKKINDCDEKMRELFEKRMEIAKDIAIYKKENNLPIFDMKRETEVVANNKAKLVNKEIEASYEEFLHKVMDISKDYQKSVIEGK